MNVKKTLSKEQIIMTTKEKKYIMAIDQGTTS
jgi:hypothetical protein